MVSLHHYLVLSAILLIIGIYGVITRRNIIGILMSIEIIFNATNINLVAFNHYFYPRALWGQGFAIFVITLAAAEAVVGLSLVLAIYRNLKTLYVERINILKG
ncbi:MAG: NADH-quinone oxidoreductase subunit K [Elusimicrobia bacterium RIFCSPLOWO2_02_FULL_39_32]|nr:MAG: NADH-quinone oxidoreductase subunit K [Elusimicrobia bacterium RIFCSPHIGHO2_02_FULL_39_36]OGR91407.1 MAG: NADH-quinone oxidoreductase subunit K [Elusimicrobia bacterium RIFCSPLOWO2_02_FULL_39_32]OGR98522.1 MAG: NADH-quinone oxidoreductase subunit K [Elusimicrobia bacterium RIFCSPLOWO2_12_FULL_39_28]